MKQFNIILNGEQHNMSVKRLKLQQDAVMEGAIVCQSCKIAVLPVVDFVQHSFIDVETVTTIFVCASCDIAYIHTYTVDLFEYEENGD